MKKLLATLLISSIAIPAYGQADLSGVWGLLQHDRPGGQFFIPPDPELSENGKSVTGKFAARYDVIGLEANGACVEPGMPTVMWGIGGANMEIVQQDNRITLLSELANQTRRIYLDGREIPGDFPTQRVGYSVGEWEGETLVIETGLIEKWHAPRWPHGYQMTITERWTVHDASELEIVGLFPGRGDRPEVTGKVLVNEMTIREPEFYANDEEVVTFMYRYVEDGIIFEDGCSEGIWRDSLKAKAKADADA